MAKSQSYIFLLYINDIPQALPAVHTQLYADDTSMFYQDKGIMEIENVLNNESANVWEWFVDNELSIHFGEDKNKWILFNEEKNCQGITYENNRMKQFHKVECLRIIWTPI